MDTYECASLTLKNGGGTFLHTVGRIDAYDTDSLTNGDNSWCVAVAPDEPECSNIFKDYSRFPFSMFAAEDIVTVAVWDFITNHHQSGVAFGTWIKDGVLYIDHVVITSKDNALNIARERGELAIYNLKTKETITL